MDRYPYKMNDTDVDAKPIPTQPPYRDVWDELRAYIDAKRAANGEEQIMFGPKEIYVPRIATVDYVEPLLTFAVKHTGRRNPGIIPPIRFFSTLRLSQIVHGHIFSTCAGAYLSPPLDEIWLSEDLYGRDDLRTQSVLLHELVHFLQSQEMNMNGLSLYETHAIEVEAYTTQLDWCVAKGVEMTPPWVKSHNDIVTHVRQTYTY